MFNGFGYLVAGGSGGVVPGPHGSSMKLDYLEEEITVLAAANTDSVLNLIPAGCLIFCAMYRVTALIPTAATFDIGDNSGSANDKFGSAIAVALGTNDNQWSQLMFTAPFIQSTPAGSAKIRITPNAVPAAATGKVRVIVWFWRPTNPTS